MVAPIIPALNSEEIPAIIKAAAENGACSAGYTIVRLNGSIAEIFKDWIYQNFPDRAEKVLHQIQDCHGGNLNDSRWGKRIKGEGQIADAIQSLFYISKAKYMKDRRLPALNTTLYNPKAGCNQLSIF